MKIIVQGDRNIQSILSRAFNSNVSYQLSRYTIQHDVDDGKLLLNTITGELVLLSPEESETSSFSSSYREETLKELIKHCFVVPEGCEEDKNLDQLRKILRIRRDKKNVIKHYNILPTTACNARCFYCYEHGIKQTTMSKGIADKVVSFISDHHGEGEIVLAWFGGEPSLVKGIIDYICSQLCELKIQYVSKMVSNAYLFDKEMVKHAKKEWKLKTIQITLDGTEQVYNAVKSYVNNTENPYQRVIRNIQYFLEEGIKVNIRLNLDEHNADDLSTLIDELTNRFTERQLLSIYIRQLRENVGSKPINHNAEEKSQLWERYVSLQEKLEKNGWNQIWNFKMPNIGLYTCMADDPLSIQITPDGILGKCEDYIYDKTVGSLDAGITDSVVAEWWKERVQYEQCGNCPLFPSCTHLLKHCPTRLDECDEYDRNKRINLCHIHMIKAYEQWKSKEKKQDNH